MTGVSHAVCNMFLFLFVLYRAEEDMVSTNAYFLACHEGNFKKPVTVIKGVEGFDDCHVFCWHSGNLLSNNALVL